MTPARPQPGPAPRAFTIVEMLVAIGIIVILAAITVSASVVLVERTEVRQSQDTLQLLDLAVSEWEAQADRKLTWGAAPGGISSATFDMYDDVPHVYTTSEVLYRIGSSPATKSVLARIRPEFIKRYDAYASAPPWIALTDVDDPDPNKARASTVYESGALHGREIDDFLVVLDPWGVPIRAVHPGRIASAAFGDDLADANADGTVHIDAMLSPEYRVEEIYGIASNRRMLFVSAGPDGKFGDVSSPADGTEEEQRLHDQVHDNVYSYAIDVEP